MFMLVCFGGCGLLIAALGVPLWRRRVAPNPYYGLRTAATKGDTEVWYAANARSGRDTVITGLVIAVTALVVYLAGIPEEHAGLIDATVTVVAVLVLCVTSVRAARAMVRERDRG